jgi:hypothetical protein
VPVVKTVNPSVSLYTPVDQLYEVTFPFESVNVDGSTLTPMLLPELSVIELTVYKPEQMSLLHPVIEIV